MMDIKNATSIMMEGLAPPHASPPIAALGSPYSGSPALSSSSGISISFPSDMAEGSEDEDLFWTARHDERSGNAVFCPSTPMSPVHHRFTPVSSKRYSQDSPTKLGGIPVELALFSDKEDTLSCNQRQLGRPLSLEIECEHMPTCWRSRANQLGQYSTREGSVQRHVTPPATQFPPPVSRV